MTTKHEKELRLLEEKSRSNGHVSGLACVAYGGSHAYGLATPDSDVDLRGFAFPTAQDILKLHDFEQVQTMDGVDATIYSLHKATGLLLGCNPNVIEILGLRPEHVLLSSPVYKKMVANKEIYLSRRAAATFGGYATQQLRRIQNAMSRDGHDARRLADSALRSMNAAIASFPDRYAGYADGMVELRVADDGDNAPEVLADFHVSGLPAHELRGLCGELDDINKNAAQLGKNRRRTKDKISKHASHLFRLLAMGSELLETGEVNTYRRSDAELLLALKKGLFLKEDADGVRTYEPEFWEMLDEAEKRFKYAQANTILPERPDEEAALELVMEAHCNIVVENCGLT